MARPGDSFMADTDIPYVAPSPIPLPSTPDIVPHELTKEGEYKRIILEPVSVDN